MRRWPWLFVLVVAGEVVLLARRAATSDRGVGLEELGLRAIAPLGRLVTAAGHGGATLGSAFRGRTSLLRENEKLRAELERQRLELLRRQSLEEEVERLAAAVDFGRAEGGALRFHVAEVIYADYNSWLRTLLVRAPGAAPRRNQGVVASQGVVGRVVAAGGDYARVQLVLDLTAAVGAELERTERQGVVRGDGRGGLAMDFVPRQADVQLLDVVVTAGIDGVFPPGLPVGVVTAVSAGDGELFHRIALAPAVDFGRLGAVYLLDTPAPPPAVVAAEPEAGNGP
jgi:rod shape-determining protein MreC